MTALQLWMLAGVLGMAGVACLVWYLAPAEPDLADVVGRLSPTAAVRGDGRADDALTLTDRVGLWMVGRAPSGWLKVPVQDLALLGRPIHVFYAEKLLVVVVAAIAIPVATSALLLVGVPVYVPVVLTAVGAFLAWFWPNQALRENAAQARAEFTAALGAYVDLVALERKAGGVRHPPSTGERSPGRRLVAVPADLGCPDQKPVRGRRSMGCAERTSNRTEPPRTGRVRRPDAPRRGGKRADLRLAARAIWRTASSQDDRGAGEGERRRRTDGFPHRGHDGDLHSHHHGARAVPTTHWMKEHTPRRKKQ